MNMIDALFRQRRLRMCGMAAVCVLTASALVAQSPLPRLQSDISSSQMTALRGSQVPLAIPQNDAGRVPAGTRLEGITLYFNRTPAQQADLNGLLAAQQDRSSPLFHKWLTPDQFAARFGMAQADIDRVSGWLQQKGFTVDMVMHSRNAIRFSGTVAQVEDAFRTEMHYYNVAGEKHMAPATALSVPAGMAGVVAGVRNLDDFRPKPQHVRPRPGFTSASGGNVFFAPGDIVTTYDIGPLYQAGVDGTGQTIAIMGQSYVAVGDIEAFQNAAGLTIKDPTLVYVPGSGNDGTFSTGDEGESDLDLEWSSAIAPGANVVFVYTGSDQTFGVYDSAQYAVDNLIGNIISLSYSSCETVLTQNNLTVLEGIFSQAAAQGQTVVAASGDQGSTACSGYKSLTAAQQQALAVNYPASSAYVTGVGGTEITQANGAGNSTYWQSASGSDVIDSAKQYIPEVVWNDDSAGPPPYVGATGGGISTLVARPTWQKGVPGIPSGTFRLVPDISFYSSAAQPGYLFCTSDQNDWNLQGTPPQSSSCTNGFRDNSSAGWLTAAGGTSFATPIFAGMMALLNENSNYTTGSGEVNAQLYALAANSTTYSTVFHDVTQGNNNCSADTTTCGSSLNKGFAAGAGYDMATGLGSFDVAQMATVFPLNSGASAALIPTNVTVVPANPTPDAGTDDVFTITVNPAFTGGGIPTGTVTLLIDGGTAWGTGGTTLTNQTLDATGAVTYTANFTASGTHQVIAQYSGDATYAPSTGIGELSIASGSGKGKIAMTATDVTVAQGSTASSTITVTPSGGYTGTVNLTIDFGSSDTTLGNLCYSFTTMDSSGTGSLQVTGTAAATTQLSLDTNASDCASPTGGVLPGKHQLRELMRGGKFHAANHNPGQPGKNRLPLGIAFAGLLFAGLLGRHSHKLRGLACILALGTIGMALTACGGSSNGGGGGPSDPPKGTYTATLTGTDSVTSTITTTANFTFKIN